jgi:transposase
MRHNDGRKLDHATLEAVRIRAVQQIQSGVRPAEVAKVLGLNPSTIFTWVAMYRHGGVDALRARAVPGRPSSLTVEQTRRLYALVVNGDPRRLGFESALWTRGMVRGAIHREFAVSLSAVTVGRLLRDLRLAPQPSPYSRAGATPVTRMAEEYRQIRAEAIRTGATLYFGSHPVAPDPDAPPEQATRIIAVEQPRGPVRFFAYRGVARPEIYVDFCQRLLHDSPGPVVLAIERSPILADAVLTGFVAAAGSRLRVVQLARPLPTP